MEEVESDDLELDKDKRLVLQYRGLAEVPNLSPSLSDNILILDVSFNNILTLPSAAILELRELRELNCANNELVSIPREVYTLPYLKVLRANGNKISIFPDGIGKCRRLERLILSENELSLLPDDLAECQKLRELKLQNNCLKQLPISLGKLHGGPNCKLVEFNVSNNPDLHMIPSHLRGNTNVILWILLTHYETLTKVKDIETALKDMTGLLLKSQRGVTDFKESIDQYSREENNIRIELSSVEHYLSVCAFITNCKKRFATFVR
eukprot:CAMPEP_0194430318 /NCGR_PEP_ID=MMETSP0176-20130528/54328_1 /TAXON_ID=216777 /ORGANISM="Proboscia alata, Strain PI-D3" /LENGTH=265 /DNA_ID=CAMNT_0039244471 /DNA_START=56 /DNA_END=850 /DNA_ORIENTATION=+